MTMRMHTFQRNPQQRLLCGIFSLYQRREERAGKKVNIGYPVPDGDTLLFENLAWGDFIYNQMFELAEILRFATRFRLHQPAAVQCYLKANQVRWAVSCTDTLESCKQRVDEYFQKTHLDYLDSPQYVEDEAATAAAIAANYTRCHHVVQSLQMSFDLFDVASWVITFVETSNCLGGLTDEDAAHVGRRFQIMGYTADEGVGTEPKTFEERVRYIVGQVMSSCRIGAAPVEILKDFAAQAIKDHLEPSNETASNS